MNTNTISEPSEDERYGIGDASYRAAGQFAGIQALVRDFYEIMDALPEAANIRAMHAGELSLIYSKLAHFLCYWMGGPRKFMETHGPVSIPQAHSHLPITAKDRDAWLLCMEKALARQAYKDSFKQYLLEQLAVPAERITQVCERNKK